MDFDKYIKRREQKQAYQIFTKEALIDMVVRKNELIAEQQAKLLNLHIVINF